MASDIALTEELIADRVLQTREIIAAFRAIDRRNFVPAALAARAYENAPLPIGDGQTISQPWTVAFMLELLQPRAGDQVLEIGYCSGWQTSLLAHVVSGAAQSDGLADMGHVTALEIIPALCQMGAEHIDAYHFVQRGIVELHCRSGVAGYPARAPYNKIIAAAAGTRVPRAWREQLALGGCIVAPVNDSILRLTRLGAEEWKREDFPGFAFVPLVG